MPAELSPGEKAAISTVEQWLGTARSSTSTVELSTLVEDAGSWNGRRVVFHKRGVAAWYQLCLLREYVRRRGHLAEFAALLRYIESRGRDADVPSVQTACALVRDYIMRAVALRSIRFAREHPEATAEALKHAPKIRDDAALERYAGSLSRRAKAS